jgi:hypothetical protein
MNIFRRVVAIALLLALVSCGQESGQLDLALSDRSILSFGEDEIGSSGRFTIRDGEGSALLSQHTIPSLTGRYWKTAGGNVYTDFDVDAEVIESEMVKLLESIKGGDISPEGIPHVESLENHYRGSEFQVSYADFISWVRGATTVDMVRQFNAAFEASGEEVEDPETLVPLLRPGCLSAYEEFDVALREWTLDLDPQFELFDGVETWDLGLHDWDTISEYKAVTSICADPPPTEDSTSDDRTGIRITRESDSGGTKLVVSVDSADYVGAEFRPVLEIVMTPDNEIADPAKTANPYGLLTTMGSYLATISHCGKLPHVQTEFFESNYTGPDEQGYLGPHLFASGWGCEDPLADN